MNDNLLNAILKDTFSLALLNHKIKLLKSNLVKTFFGGEPPSLTPDDSSWLRSLPADFYQTFSKDNVYQTFSELEEKMAKLPVLTIYLAFEPDERTITAFGTYARNAFGLTLILDIKFDAKLIAGTALSWKGVYRDYSLRGKIEEKKAEISKNFKQYLNL